MAHGGSCGGVGVLMKRRGLKEIAEMESNRPKVSQVISCRTRLRSATKVAPATTSSTWTTRRTYRAARALRAARAALATASRSTCRAARALLAARAAWRQAVHGLSAVPAGSRLQESWATRSTGRRPGCSGVQGGAGDYMQYMDHRKYMQHVGRLHLGRQLLSCRLRGHNGQIDR